MVPFPLRSLQPSLFCTSHLLQSIIVSLSLFFFFGLFVCLPYVT